MAKIISHNLKEQQKGINEAVDIMKITIGPRGKNVSLSNGDVVNDGRRIAEDINFEEREKDKGAQKVRNLVRKISSDVGGGRTASAILYKELVNVGTNLLDKGFNFNSVKKGMKRAVEDIHWELDKMSLPVGDSLKQVATISTESAELGEVIANTLEKVGIDSVVTVETSNTFGVTTEIADGLKFDKGFVSPFMINNEQKEAIYEKIPVLITDKKISFFKELQPVFDSLMKKGEKSILIIAEDLDGEALNVCVLAKIKGQFNTLAIKTPGIGDLKKFCIEDLCALTGAELWTEYSKEPKLGSVEKVKSTEKETIIYGGDVQTWVTTLKTRREMTENKWEKDQFDERIAKLQNGIAIIKVGASSDDDIKYLKLKIEDGVSESKRAIEEGVVVGGDCAIVNAGKYLFRKKGLFISEEDKGYNIVLDSLKAPLEQIIKNGGYNPKDAVSQITKTISPSIGYDSISNKVVEDMYEAGIIDATKVVKTSLEYAVDEAILFLSLGGSISDK